MEINKEQIFNMVVMQTQNILKHNKKISVKEANNKAFEQVNELIKRLTKGSLTIEKVLCK